MEVLRRLRRLIPWIPQATPRSEYSPAVQALLEQVPADILAELQETFPEGCSFHWDGVGVPHPISLAIYEHDRGAPLERFCNGCRVHNCPVRKAEYHSLS